MHRHSDVFYLRIDCSNLEQDELRMRRFSSLQGQQQLRYPGKPDPMWHLVHVLVKCPPNGLIWCVKAEEVENAGKVASGV